MKGKILKDVTENKCEETIIEREFGGMPRGRSGVIDLKCPIKLINDKERFIQSLSSECRSHSMPDIDVLKLLPTPTVKSSLIECFYFLEVHIYFRGVYATQKL